MKSYLRYEPKHQFGVITSPQCNVQYDYTGNLAFTGAIQDVCVWNLRQASLVGNINKCVSITILLIFNSSFKIVLFSNIGKQTYF